MACQIISTAHAMEMKEHTFSCLQSQNEYSKTQREVINCNSSSVMLLITVAVSMSVESK